MKRKVYVLIIAFTLILNCKVVYGDDLDEEELESTEIREEIAQTSANNVDEPSINSKAAIVIDRESKRILFCKNMNDKRAMASTTKIMTCIIALENSKLDDTITVSKTAAAVGGSRLGLSKGDKITMNDLLYGLMMRSGNDAAAQIAETIGGGYEGFANLMNKKAKEIGLKNTHFVTPHGLDNDEHYTTAYELAILTDYALNNKKFAQIVESKTKYILINGVQRELHNTNELLGVLNGVSGVKTGFTCNAGRCLVTSCKRDDMDLIGVVLGADTKKLRTKDSIKILEYAYKNYSYANLKEMLMHEFDNWKRNNKVAVTKGKEEYIELTLTDIVLEKYPVKKSEEEKIDIFFECEKVIEAPVFQFEQVGVAKIYIGKEKVMETKILASKDLKRKSVMDYIKIMLNKSFLQLNLQLQKQKVDNTNILSTFCFCMIGGATRNRTGDQSFADSCLTAWL